jgi:Domain of unknown function (DUF4440)
MWLKLKMATCILFFSLLSDAFSQDKDIAQLTKLNQEWIQSYLTKDSVTLAGILADDFILVSAAGTKMTKAQVLSDLNLAHATSRAIDSVEVRLITADVGLVTAYTSFIIKGGGKNIAANN